MHAPGDVAIITISFECNIEFIVWCIKCCSSNMGQSLRTSADDRRRIFMTNTRHENLILSTIFNFPGTTRVISDFIPFEGSTRVFL